MEIGLWERRLRKNGHAIAWGLFFLFLFASALTSVHAQTQYRYDPLGRLINVINSDGSVIEYQYDTNGNVTAINRIGVGTLSIVAFSPVASHVGASVTIYGAGFNPDPNQNTVTIGGAAASISSAHSNSLVVTVPSLAETGPVEVTVGGQTVTSSENLVVRRPSITEISPAVTNPGAQIALAGAHLNLLPGSTSVLVGSSAVNISSLTNSQAVFTAPSGSGYVSVNTSYGQATSATPLTVLPSAISPANVIALGQLTSGSTGTLNVNQASRYGIFQFDGTQGEYSSIQISSLATTPSNSSVSYQVYSPSGEQIGSGILTAAGRSIHLPVFAVTGTYTIAFTSSTATFLLTSVLEPNAAVLSDGTTVGLTTGAPAQTKRFTFYATAGEYQGLGISNLTKTNGHSSYQYQRVNIYRPDGSTWVSNSACYVSTGCAFNLTIPTTGVYSVLVFSPSPSSEPNLTMSFTATLSRDLVVSVPANTPTSVSLDRHGQNGWVQFSATAGAAMGVQIGGIGTTPAGRALNLTILKPDGSVLTGTTAPTVGYAFHLQNLPTTGTYTLYVDPQHGAAANLTVTTVSGADAAVVVDGPSRTFNTSAAPGQYAYWNFYATAGEYYGLGISNLTKTNGHSSYQYQQVNIYRPDGSTWVSNSACYVSTGCAFNLTIPTTGVYSVLVSSPSPSSEPNLTMSFTATLSRDLVVSVPSNTPTSVSLNRHGQNGWVQFSATAGISASVQVSGISTVPSGRIVYFTVLRPDGTTQTSGNSATGITLNLTNPPATGTYTLIVDPQYGATANLTVTVQ